MNKILLTIVIVLIIIVGAYWVLGDGPEYANPNTKTDTDTTVNPSTVTSGENPEPGSQVHDLPVEPAAARARKDLAAELGVGEGNIVIMQVAEATWNDGCLGLGRANESCLQALTPGFKVEMLAQGKTYVYRTDKTGQVLRAE